MAKYKCQIIDCQTEAFSWIPKGVFGTILCHRHTMEFIEKMCDGVETVMVYPVGWMLPMFTGLPIWEECPATEE
jgi:hypothetical protein